MNWKANSQGERMLTISIKRQSQDICQYDYVKVQYECYAINVTFYSLLPRRTPGNLKA